MDSSECDVNITTYSQDVNQTDMANSDNEALEPTDSSTSVEYNYCQGLILFIYFYT